MDKYAEGIRLRNLNAPSNGNYNFKFTCRKKCGQQRLHARFRLHQIDSGHFAAAAFSYEQWQAAEFGINTNNPAISGDDADPDGDGVPNLMEYALGRNPLVADATNLTVIGTNSNYLTLVYHRAKIATDVTFIVEVQSDLTGAWTTNVQTPVVTDDGNSLTDEVSVEDSVPMNSTPHRFMRLRVTRP